MDQANVVTGKRKRTVAPKHVHDPRLDELLGEDSNEEQEEEEHVAALEESEDDTGSDEDVGDSSDEKSSSDEGEHEEESDDDVGVEDLDGEVWRAVPRWFLPQGTPEPEQRVLYEVSNLGRVRSLHRDAPRVLQPVQHQNGYHKYSVSYGGHNKTCLVHELVLGTFKGPYPEPKRLWHIDHDDHNMHNNAVTNLKYVPAKHNLSLSRKPCVRKGPSTAKPKAWTYVEPERPDLLNWRQHPTLPELEVAREGHVRYAPGYVPNAKRKQPILMPYAKQSDNLWVRWKGTIKAQDSQSVHRLVYRTWKGKFPANESAANGKNAERLVLHHRDGNKANKCARNLEFVSHVANCRKREGRNSNHTSGANGVHWSKDRGKWQALITVDGKRKNLGYFAHKGDAKKARRAAEKQY